jgi:preprotein translocase subunit SecG
MYALILTIHVLVCLALVFIVLLQHGRGAEMGSGFGAGSNQTLFGSTGGATFLGKVTTLAAVLFMVTSLTLAVLSTRKTATSRIITDSPAAAPATAPATVPPPAPATP